MVSPYRKALGTYLGTSPENTKGIIKRLIAGHSFCGVLGFGIGLLATKIFMVTAPLFPLIAAVSCVVLCALNLMANVYAEKIRPQSIYTSAVPELLKAGSKLLVGSAAAVACISLGIFHPLLTIVVGLTIVGVNLDLGSAKLIYDVSEVFRQIDENRPSNLPAQAAP